MQYIFGYIDSSSHRPIEMMLVYFLFLWTCFAETDASLSRFMRDLHLDDMTLPVESSVMAPVSFSDCARGCHANVSCVAFLHNHNNANCQLMSKIYVNVNGNDVEQGNRIYRMHTGVCELPKVTKEGTVQFVNGLEVGSKAVVLCNNGSLVDPAGVCDITGTWTNLDTACGPVNNVQLVTGLNLKDVFLVPGSCLSIVAIPTDRFKVNLKETGIIYNFQLDANFNAQTLIRSSKLTDEWGVDETDTPHWPFLVNREFTLTICASDTQYTVSVDNVEVCTYVYRSPLANVRTLITSSSGIGVKTVIYTVNDTDTILL